MEAPIKTISGRYHRATRLLEKRLNWHVDLTDNSGLFHVKGMIVCLAWCDGRRLEDNV